MRRSWVHIVCSTALSMFVGPGVGQIYNQEYKKGFVLIVLSLGVAVAFFAWLHLAIFGSVSSQPIILSAEQLQRISDIFYGDVLKRHFATVCIYMALILVVWIYGVLDAYLGAIRRRPAISVEAPK